MAAFGEQGVEAADVARALTHGLVGGRAAPSGETSGLWRGWGEGPADYASNVLEVGGEAPLPLVVEPIGEKARLVRLPSEGHRQAARLLAALEDALGERAPPMAER